jgi:hypothetical protein
MAEESAPLNVSSRDARARRYLPAAWSEELTLSHGRRQIGRGAASQDRQKQGVVDDEDHESSLPWLLVCELGVFCADSGSRAAVGAVME